MSVVPQRTMRVKSDTLTSSHYDAIRLGDEVGVVSTS